MRFVYDLTVPAATTEITPEGRVVALVPGRLTRILISFRRGPHNLVFVRVRQGLYRVLPVADSEAIIGDGVTHDVSMALELAPPSPELTLEGWSPNTRYSHKITFAFDITPAGGDERQTILDLLFGGGGA